MVVQHGQRDGNLERVERKVVVVVVKRAARSNVDMEERGEGCSVVGEEGDEKKVVVL